MVPAFHPESASPSIRRRRRVQLSGSMPVSGGAKNGHGILARLSLRWASFSSMLVLPYLQGFIFIGYHVVRVQGSRFTVQRLKKALIGSTVSSFMAFSFLTPEPLNR